MTTEAKHAIEHALLGCERGTLAPGGRALFEALGYRSDLRLDLDPPTPGNFIATFDPTGRLNTVVARLDEWISVDIIFQITGDEVTNLGQGRLPFDGPA